jgi:biopolymer transport protein ExbD
MSRRKPSRTLRGVTPLIDLLFLLLFSLLALSDARRSATKEPVHIRLPRVEPGETQEPRRYETIVIEIDAQSRVRLEGRIEPVRGPDHLDELLAARVGEALPEEFDVEVRGDARARHGVGVALLQHLRQRGFAGVTLLALGAEDASWEEGSR